MTQAGRLIGSQPLGGPSAAGFPGKSPGNCNIASRSPGSPWDVKGAFSPSPFCSPPQAQVFPAYSPCFWLLFHLIWHRLGLPAVQKSSAHSASHRQWQIKCCRTAVLTLQMCQGLHGVPVGGGALHFQFCNQAVSQKSLGSLSTGRSKDITRVFLGSTQSAKVALAFVASEPALRGSSESLVRV